MAHPYDDELFRAFFVPGRARRARLDHLLMLPVVARELDRGGVTKARSSLLKFFEPVSTSPRSGWRLAAPDYRVAEGRFADLLARIVTAELEIDEGRREPSWPWANMPSREIRVWPEKTSERKLGVPQRTVQKWARECVDLGLIKRTKPGPGAPSAGVPQFQMTRRMRKLLSDGLASDLGL